MLYNCEKIHENISKGFQRTERTREYGRDGNIQSLKGNNSKSRQTRVTVHVFGTLSHDALQLCGNITNGIRLTERTHGRNGYVQRPITPKVGKAELWFMCSAHCLMVLYIEVKIRENI